ncbi:MAG: hypothetical protein HFJ42_06190 [Clostridia bacterium]|nr:hypothetical protein [Clostridia bacterium]
MKNTCDDNLFMMEAKKTAKEPALKKTFITLLFITLVIFIGSILGGEPITIAYISTHIPLLIYAIIFYTILGAFLYFVNLNDYISLEHHRLTRIFNISLVNSMLKPNELCPIIMIKAKDGVYGEYIFKQATKPNSILEASLILADDEEEMVQIYLNHEKLEKISKENFVYYYQFVDSE